MRLDGHFCLVGLLPLCFRRLDFLHFLLLLEQIGFHFVNFLRPRFSPVEREIGGRVKLGDDIVVTFGDFGLIAQTGG